MNNIFTFILGVLVGWLIEWLIDFFYWRRRRAERVEAFSQSQLTSVGRSNPAEVTSTAVHAPDDLKAIKGIGVVIEGKLNEAGIHTFEQLGNLTVDELRQILGKVIERLADENSLIEQAREFARRKK